MEQFLNDLSSTEKTVLASLGAAIVIVLSFVGGYLVGYGAGERDRIDRHP